MISDPMIVERAEELDRQVLWPARGELWRGALAVSQYIERNIRVYSHPYARQRIQTWIGRSQSGDLVTSLETLEMEFVIAGNPPIRGSLIASVYTPPAHRGHDYARQLIQKVLPNPDAPVILHSDLAPRYYEKLGFRDMPVMDNKIKVEPSPAVVELALLEESIAPDHFVSELRLHKERRSRHGVAVFYDEILLDWNIERFRYFAEIMGTRLPSELFWIGVHGNENHPILAVPNYLEGQMEGLILDPACERCLQHLHRKAREAKLARVHFWKPDRRGGGKHPMIRITPDTEWVDQQAIEYW